MRRDTDFLRWNEHRLDASERPKILYDYYVTGRGDFPFDMLRYDGCWPARGEDAAKLDVSFLSMKRELRSIRMQSHRAPTVARWSSFNWSVGTTPIGEKT